MSTNPTSMYDVDPHVAELYDQQETYEDDVALLRRLMGSRRTLRILEPFCGTGRISIPLLMDGHSVVGLDRSSGMLDRARDKIRALPPHVQQRIMLVQCDTTAGVWPKGFDVVILGANCLYELATADEQEACLSFARKSLVPGGHVYVDNDHMEGNLEVSWQEPGRKPSFPTGTCEDGTRLESFTETIWFDEPGRQVRLQRSTTVTRPDGSQVSSQYEQRKRPVSEAEVRAWLQSSGFRVDWVFGNRHGQPYAPASERAIFWGCLKDTS